MKKVAIPSITSFYFTKGKEYPILSENEWGLMTVLCDKGFERCVSEGKSAHLCIPSEYYQDVRNPSLGRFEIKEYEEDHKCTKETSLMIKRNWHWPGFYSHYMLCDTCGKNWTWA